MDTVARDVAQCAKHHALPRKPVLAFESSALNHNGKVRFPAAIITRVARMLSAVIDHVEMVGGERFRKQRFDFGLYSSSHARDLGVSNARCNPHSKPFMRNQRFHGRYESNGRVCEHPTCRESGEFRAPGRQGNSFDGPGEWRWFCLEHVREFNAGYDWFAGMNTDEIYAAQAPAAGWQTESPAFRPTAGVDGMPRWADFDDPLDAIGARASDIRRAARGRTHETFSRFTPRELEALGTMGLGPEADRPQLRRRYSDLVRRYHPDRNGGDRSHEARLQQVVEAYQLLRKAEAFA